MPRKKKPLDNSTYVKGTTKDIAKDISWWKDIKFMFGWDDAPLTQTAVNKYAEVLLEWVQDEEAIDFQDFYMKIGMPRQNFEQYRKIHPILDRAWNLAREHIGSRRQKLAFFKKHGANPQTVIFTLRQYHDDWRKAYDEDQSHKKEQSSAQELLDYLKNKTLELPELDDSKRNTPPEDK